MTILSVGNFGTAWDGSICDEEHIAKALEDLGHRVIRIQRKAEIFPLPMMEYDFTLIAQWDGYKAIDHLPKPLVYWAFDYQADGQEWHEKLIDQADLYLSKRVADSKYPNWQWLSQDFAPDFLYKEDIPRDKDIEVLFTGSYLPWAKERNKILLAVDNAYSLTIHSVNEWPKFKDVRPPIMDDGLPSLYPRAKVILSIDHTIEAGYWSDRNAQILTCGRRPLFHYVPMSEVRFGDDVDYFNNILDCLNQINQKMDEPNNISVGDKYKVTNRVKDLLTIINAYRSL